MKMPSMIASGMKLVWSIRGSHTAPKAGPLVSLRFFAGLAMPDIARIQNVPLRTLERDWSYARVWLRDHIRHEAST